MDGWLSLPRLVVTFEGLKAAFRAPVRPDVLIRADGGVGPLPLSDNTLLDSPSFRQPVLLVDFADTFDRRLADRAQGRAIAYRERGWTELDDPHPTPDLDRYLAVHPHGRQYRRLIDRYARESRRQGGRSHE
jgi:hypothetical protein